MVSTGNIYKLIKACIRYMVEAQNRQEPLKDYWYYNKQIKDTLKKESIYKEVMENWQLKGEPYGLNYRVNKAEMRELQRDPTATVSIFDDYCFIFYLVKYCEIMGLEAIIACQSHISYV